MEKLIFVTAIFLPLIGYFVIMAYYIKKENKELKPEKQPETNNKTGKTKVTTELHARPYKDRKNNRKLTMGRLANKKNAKVQSIPIYNNGIFIGYKYIFHPIKTKNQKP